MALEEGFDIAVCLEEGRCGMACSEVRTGFSSTCQSSTTSPIRRVRPQRMLWGACGELLLMARCWSGTAFDEHSRTMIAWDGPGLV